MTEKQLAKKEVRLQLKAKRLVEKEKAYKTTITKLVKKEQAFNKLTEIMKSLAEIKGKIISTKKAGTTNNRIDIVTSDIHYSGKRNDAEVKKLFKKQLELVKQLWWENKTKKIRLVFLGDDIEGELHLSSLDKHQQENTINQVIGITKHYLDFIESVGAIVGYTNVEVVFVPESNHGQLRLHGMSRGQQPRNDVGYIIRGSLIKNSNKKIKFWPSTKGIVITNDTIYCHGDKGWARSSDKARLYLGKDKHIVMGHWHTLKVSQHGTKYLIVAPKATANRESYSDEAGYEETPAQILWICYGKKGDIQTKTVGV